MGRVTLRPVYAVDYGSVETVGSGVVLGDNDDGTFKRYFTESGSILTYDGNYNGAGIPAGREIIAVRVAHRQRNTGLLGMYNGWVSSYLRYDGKRQSQTHAYKQDGYIDGARTIEGPAFYNTNLAPWTVDDINKMSSEAGAATGQIGPNTRNFWCVASESFIIVVYNDLVPVPSAPFPANNETIATSSVNFSAVLPAPQSEQPVRAIFQVARDVNFTDDVRTFVPDAKTPNASTTAGSRSYYVSDKLKDSYTNLGPGKWYLRIKGRDHRGVESAWSATTSFTITHTALPVPTLSAPVNSSTVASPYSVRSGVIATQPAGDRRVGIGWRFSKVNTFASGVVEWTNRTGGVMLASAEDPQTVSYNPQPDPTILPGLAGPKVSIEDPSQYLSQGVWFAQVRCVDVYGQAGAWSTTYSFTVAHKPVAAVPVPSGDASFDPLETPLRWKFTDPWSGDFQSAYRVRLMDLSNNVLWDSGKVTSANARAEVGLTEAQIAPLLHSYFNWGLTIWDSDDVQSNVELVSKFRMSVSPVITLTYPAPDEQIISGQPNIAWSAVFARAGLVQKSFQIKFIESASGKVAFDTGEVVSPTMSYLPPKPILKNLSGYQLQLTVTDSENLSNTLHRNFSTNFERPASVQAYSDPLDYSEMGYVSVDWTGAMIDPFFMEWRVYQRKLDKPDTWQLAGTVQDPSITNFKDWLVAGQGEFIHSVTQAAYRFGSIVESALDDGAIPFTVFSDSWWFISPEDESLNVRLHSVSSAPVTDNMETNQYTILNGGRRQVYGTRLGISGNLTCKIRYSQRMTATEAIEALRKLQRNGMMVIMRDPFGNVTRIALGEIGKDPLAGVGAQEYADLDIPIAQVGKVDEGITAAPTIQGGSNTFELLESPPGSGLFVAVVTGMETI